MTSIVSSIPGRLRLRHAGLRNPDRLERLRAAIAAWAGVQTLTANPATGSLLVTYDPAVLPEAEGKRRVEAAVTALLPRATAQRSDSPAPPAHKPSRAGWTPASVNRLAKPAMLGSLVTSLAFAAAGAKRVHIVAGVAFLHALGAHLWVQRRNLFR